MHRFRNFLVMLAPIVLLNACGFHLRGMVNLPKWLHNVAIVSEPGHRDLTAMLAAQLRAYQIVVNPNPETAAYWMIIQEEPIQQNVTGISSGTTPRQYQLVYTVHVTLQRARGKEILPSTPIIITRQATMNGDRILGSIYEEDTLKREMRHDAVVQIMNHLHRVGSSASR